MVWTNSNSQWHRLVGMLNRRCSDPVLFPDPSPFVFHRKGDRFIRPSTFLQLNRLLELEYGVEDNPFKAMTVFPAIGSSSDIAMLYYGLRTGGFGDDGVMQTAKLWKSIEHTPGLAEVLTVGLGDGYEVSGECWLAYKFFDPESLDELAEVFISFIERLHTAEPPGDESPAS